MLITHCHFFFLSFFQTSLNYHLDHYRTNYFCFYFSLETNMKFFLKIHSFCFLSQKQIWNSFSKIHSFVFYPKNILKFFSYNSFFYFLSQKHIWNSFYEIHFFFYLKNISEIIFIKLILSCIIVLDLYFLLKI